VKRLYLIEYLHARLREAAPARLGCGQLVEVIQAGCEGGVALRAKQLRYRRDVQIAKQQCLRRCSTDLTRLLARAAYSSEYLEQD